MEPLHVRAVPDELLDYVRGCPQFLELVALQRDASYSTSAHVQDVNIERSRKRKNKPSGREQQIAIPWIEVSDGLKVRLAAFIGCNAHDLTSVSFMAFQRAEGIDGHCDQAWVGDSFWGFSIVLQSEPSSALPYNLVFRAKNTATVVGEHVVRSNSAYHCSGNNRHKFKHEVAPASAGRRFFVRVGLN